ncbi:hypothetical protein ACJJTC_016085 [Scirpophaga incertulas]
MICRISRSSGGGLSGGSPPPVNNLARLYSDSLLLTWPLFEDRTRFLIALTNFEANIIDRPETVFVSEIGADLVTVESDSFNSHKDIATTHTSLRKSINSDRTISPTVLVELLKGRSEICKTPEQITVPVLLMQDSVEQTSSKKDASIAISQHIAPLDSRPSPKVQPNKTNRKRKPHKAEILTSTPVKDEQRAKYIKKII